MNILVPFRYNLIQWVHRSTRGWSYGGSIIDPRTGYPSTGIISVTVFAPKAELADALATSVFVMGKEAGLDRINQLPKIECIIINLNSLAFLKNSYIGLS